eukprot:TRINITY_DN446_c0_g1_i1.p1 TRINITY_DN446_c0_g1~~TRINITY_DN446_c0_g1_i1.p1  ORF type:complete len:590 (+),score=132.76 TRINITY_DN446_c0_g1_i1:168-1937(+)
MADSPENTDRISRRNCPFPREPEARKRPRLCSDSPNSSPSDIIQTHNTMDSGHNGRASTPSSLEKNEVLRLMIQSLNEYGYGDCAQLLTKQSGIHLESEGVTAFRKAIENGDWSGALSLLDVLDVRREEDLCSCKFLIAQQKYLELLERRNVNEALVCLRTELTPLKQDPARLHKLSGLIMCNDLDAIKKKTGWTGSSSESRLKLLDSLREFVSPSVIVPDHRLETLLLQALEKQRGECLYYNVLQENFGLFSDRECPRSALPRATKHILSDHQDEVWYVKFSNDGRYLASASKDTTAIIWDMQKKPIAPFHVLGKHTKALSFLAWSPDDSMLLTCGNDVLVMLWDVKSGQCLQTFNKHSEVVSAVAWLPDNRRFVTAGQDKKIFLLDIDGNELRVWTGGRINDIAVTSDGKRMVAVCRELQIRFYRLDDEEETTSECLLETSAITSLALARDNRHLVLNIASQEIHVWDIVKRSLVQKYIGHKQGRFVIRSNFGGANETFVVSGSEDSQVYVWHRHRGTLLEVLKGHTATVNSVDWNPTNPFQFVSASDDNTIRVWECSDGDESDASNGSHPISATTSATTATLNDKK